MVRRIFLPFAFLRILYHPIVYMTKQRLPYYSGEIHFPKEQISIRKQEILRLLKVPPAMADDYLNSLIDEFAVKVLNISNPKGAYVLLNTPGFIESSKLHIAEKTFDLGKIVYSAMQNSSTIAFFIVSAGDQAESLSKQLIHDGHYLEGLIADLTGSEIAESAARLIHDKIQGNASELNLRTSNRYSPGYCNWPISDQKMLFGLFPKNTCSISLSDSSLMKPLKSVSGMIGIGKDVVFKPYMCSKCQIPSCIYRDH
jgi:hypothetical protein